MRLVEFSVFPTESEMGMWEANCETIKQQIELKNSKSMTDLGKDSVFAEIVNTVIERMPRDSDIFRSAAIQSKAEFADIKRELLESLFHIMENILKDPEEFHNNESELDNGAFLEVITLFLGSEGKNQRLTTFFQNVLKAGILKKVDIEAYWDKIDWVMTELLSLCQQNKENFDRSPEKYASIIVEYLVTVGSIATDVARLTVFLEENSVKVSKEWIERIPSLFEDIINRFDYPTLFDVATSLDAFPLRKVFQTRSFALQSLVQAFVQLSSFFAKDQNGKQRIWQEVQKSERFVEFMHVYEHDLVLEGFSKDYSTILKNAKKNAEKETVERLRKCGYLENLGSPADPFIRSQIDTIIDVLPHLSPQFAHLALRHYSYISSDALASLLSREHLPIELLRLENFDFSTLNPNSSSGSEWPPLDFTASDEIEKSVNSERKAREEEARKNRNKKDTNLFSLALSSSSSSSDLQNRSSPTNEMDEKAIMKKKAEEYKARVMSQLRAIRPSTKNRESDENDGEVLVPMATSKTFSALNSLKISKADEIAIRPSYDKYRYETPNDDGMYDDEYDDEFDTREFNIERLNEELVSSSDGEDAQDPSEDGKKPAEASSQGHNRGGGNGGRGRGRGRGGRGGPSTASASSGAPAAPNQQSSDSGYTGGRARQMKERHKSDFKQRGADKKRRGGMI